jgi:ketosteroid isomerase-like protein
VSRENVELVRAIYDAFVRADFEVALSAIDPSVVWDLTHHDWPGPAKYHGHDGILEVLSEWMGTFENYEVEVEDLVDAGDRVVVIQHETAIHKASAAGIDRRTASIYTIRDGRAVMIDNYLDPEEALEAVGLRE